MTALRVRFQTGGHQTSPASLRGSALNGLTKPTKFERIHCLIRKDTSFKWPYQHWKRISASTKRQPPHKQYWQVNTHKTQAATKSPDTTKKTSSIWVFTFFPVCHDVSYPVAKSERHAATAKHDTVSVTPGPKRHSNITATPSQRHQSPSLTAI